MLNRNWKYLKIKSFGKKLTFLLKHINFKYHLKYFYLYLKIVSCVVDYLSYIITFYSYKLNYWCALVETT